MIAYFIGTLLAIIGLVGINFLNLNFYAGIVFCTIGVILMRFSTYVLDSPIEE